jgi:glycosyltransferase involved in cell wall biosynthesis
MIETTRARSGIGSGAAESRPRIALAHDWLCGYRGGEAVLERIAALAAGRGEIAGLYVMFDDARPLSPTIDDLRRRGLVRAAGLNRWPGAQDLRRWMLPLYPGAVEDLSRQLARESARRPIEVLISTSSAAIKGLRPPAGVPHICYCHSPARYVWSQAEQYTGRGLRGRVRSAALAAYGPRFKRWDRATAAHVSQFVANSRATAALIESAFGRESLVLHPPVRTGFFTPDDSRRREEFWLVVSALEPYKRVDIAIRAAKAAAARLVISGRGSQMQALQGLAAEIGADVDFRGRTTDEELRDLYRSARVLIHPQIEDFGIAAVEAQACGLPVAAFKAGGALDTVIPGSTGAFFESQDQQAIAGTVAQVPQNPRACRENALRFSEAEFDRRFSQVLEEALAQR